MAERVIHGTIGSVWTRRTGKAAGYRPDLDGLRGVAVALVVLYHLGAVPGGGIGVTIFFVLSGYLITSILLRERERTGAIGLGAFYLRRARRLFPALALVMAAVFAGMWLVGEASAVPFLFTVTGMYIGNYAEAAGANLYALGHTWSLAIEEQFYLVWPLALLALFRFRREWVAGGLLVGAGIIIAARLWTAMNGPLDAAMYPTQLRADGLLLGCALALVPLTAPRWMVGTGIAALGASLLLWPPLAVAVAAVATVPLLASRMTWLEWRPLVYLGVISYGVYLWHVPVLYVLRPWPWLVIPVTLALAAASYHWWESRFRTALDLDRRSEVLGEPLERSGRGGEEGLIRSGGRAVAQAQGDGAG